jgi:hypothetical protein
VCVCVCVYACLLHVRLVTVQDKRQVVRLPFSQMTDVGVAVHDPDADVSTYLRPAHSKACSL